MNRAFSLLASIYLLAACQRIPIVVDALVENPCSGEEIAFHFNELMISHDLEIVGKAFHAHIVSLRLRGGVAAYEPLASRSKRGLPRRGS